MVEACWVAVVGDGAVYIQEAKPSDTDRCPRQTDRRPPAPAQEVSPRPGTALRGRELGRGEHPRSRLMVIGLLGNALGSPPPGKLKPSARHNYCMDNYTIQSLLENPGLVPEQRGRVLGL